MKDAIEEFRNSDDSKEYFELLKIPTVGSAKERLGDMARAATGLKKWLERIGARVECLLPEAGRLTPELSVPIVFAELKGAEDAPTVLFYGHYDVQPPDPLEAWITPPFEPTWDGDRIRARGAQDNKGQMFAFLCGVRELTKAKGGKLPNLKILLDGQEESGSVGLFKLLDSRAFRSRLAADVLLVADTSAAGDLRPAIVAGLRGVNHFQVTLSAAKCDLHSGEYGGIAPNAADALARLIASLHDEKGAIAVAGFGDGIEMPSGDELAAAEQGLADAAGYEKDMGIAPTGGERGRSIAERNGFLPTIEVNGFHSGYGGAGSKTIIPATAFAKISTRLVPGQSPKAAYEAIVKHLRERCPEGMKLEFSELTGLSPGFRLPLASPIFRLAGSILAEMDARGAVFQWVGASIPVIAAVRSASGAAPLLVGWGQAEDHVHSPNESFSIQQFLRVKTWAMKILEAL